MGGPLSKDEAVALFTARVPSAKGDPRVERIVALLGYNRAAIQLVAARARDEPIERLLAVLEELDAPSSPDARARIEGAARDRTHGRLPDAARALEDTLASIEGDPAARADAHRLLAAVQRAQGRIESAAAHAERARAIAQSLGDESRRAAAIGELGAIFAARGRLNDARRCHEEALAIHRTLGRRDDEGTELSRLGVALQRLGQLDEARQVHEAAMRLHVETKDARLEAADRLHLAWVAHASGDFAAARVGFEDALARFRAIGERALEGVTLAHAAMLDVEEGRTADAGPKLRRALAIAVEVQSTRNEASTLLFLAAHERAIGAPFEAHVERAIEIDDDPEQRAWGLALLGRFDEARAIEIEDPLTRRAIELLHAGTRELLAATPMHGTRVREAARLLPTNALEVAAEARSFRTPEGVVVDLARRKPLRLVLAFLVDRRRDAPGEGVTWQALLAAGWPGERVRGEAGFARVRNALAQLRKSGLRDVLITRDDGYLLDPKVPLRRPRA